MTTQEILELLDKNTVIEILEELGSPCWGSGTTSQGVDYLMFQTICHGGDSPNKLWWYEDTKSFQCWTCCGNMSIFNLVMKVKNWDFKQSLYYVAQKVGISNFNSEREGFQNHKSIQDTRSEIAKLEKNIENKKNKRQTQEITTFYNPNIMNYYDNQIYYQGWIDEGITVETMQKYNIRFYWEGHIIIPHYDIQGRLIGIRRRSLNPEDSNNKYMPAFLKNRGVETFYEHPLGLSLYGLYQNHEAIKKSKTAIIVEGEKSVMLSDSFYGDNSIAVATCGFNISDWQIKALKQLGVTTVFLGFDKDFDITKENVYKQDEKTYKKFQRYTERITALGQKLAVFFNTYIIYDKRSLLDLKDSPMDKGKQTLEKLITDARILR